MEWAAADESSRPICEMRFPAAASASSSAVAAAGHSNKQGAFSVVQKWSHQQQLLPLTQVAARTSADLSGGEAARRARALLHVQGRLATSTAHDVRLVVAHAKALCSLRLHPASSQTAGATVSTRRWSCETPDVVVQQPPPCMASVSRCHSITCTIDTKRQPQRHPRRQRRRLRVRRRPNPLGSTVSGDDSMSARTILSWPAVPGSSWYMTEQSTRNAKG
jgi:hypothetical protein